MFTCFLGGEGGSRTPVRPDYHSDSFLSNDFLFDGYQSEEPRGGGRRPGYQSEEPGGGGRRPGYQSEEPGGGGRRPGYQSEEREVESYEDALAPPKTGTVMVLLFKLGV